MLHEVLNRPPEERQAYLTSMAGDEPGVKAALEHLLAFSSDAQTLGSGFDFPSTQSPDAAERMLASDDLSGYRFGAYELLQRIGKGGMGYVYAARRADQEFRKLVAVKLVKPGMQTDQIVSRFRQERQVLARLDHPNIASLLDGGTERGLPYIVMEHVEGTPIDEYCFRNRLTVSERLRLFLTVCSAVQYAHQSLVVHRDIKPSNILVTADGVPKLLDFGIAKVLNPDPEDDQAVTRAHERPMTPDYASPEQVRGEPITTASDVYALGLLLYELLTTEHPLRRGMLKYGLDHRTQDHAPEPPSTVVFDLEPSATGLNENPARLRSLMRGDLDAIVLMTLRQEPNRRYASVEHLAEDIRNHLDGLPVRAHRDSFRYRANKFIRRNAAPATAASVALLALIASSIVSWIFYYEADHQRQRAEARFSDVRQLARFVLFDFDQIIREGQTPARKAVLEKATEYLARLERDRGGDPSVESELVDGYIKIGDVQGNLWSANLGDPKAALRSYQKAVAVLDSSHSRNPVQSAQVRSKLADLLLQEGLAQDAVAAYDKARLVLLGAAAKDPQARKALVSVVARLAFAYSQSGNAAGALGAYQEMQTAARAALADDPKLLEVRRQLATAEVRTGDARARLHGIDKGLPEMLHGLASHREMANAAPASPGAQRPVSFASGMIGDVLVLAGRHREAVQYFRNALHVVEQLARRDTRNAQYARDRITYLGRLADAEAHAGNAELARALTRQTLALLKPAANDSQASEFELYQYVWTLVTTPFADLRNWPEAERCAARLVTISKGQDARSLDLLARTYAGIGKYADALEMENRAIALLPAGKQSDLRTELEANRQQYQLRADRRPASQ